jgi:hypothetical protein
MASTSKRPLSGRSGRRPLAFPVEFRVRIVKLYLEGYIPNSG